MPLINVRTSLEEISNSDGLLKQLSAEMANLTGKPEKYVMTLLQTNLPMTFSGSNEPSCYIEIKSIGSLKPELMSQSFCKIISSMTKIPSNRIYIGFEDVQANKWGFNGSTFA